MAAVTEAGSNSPDRPQTVENHAVQFVGAEVNISVNMQTQAGTAHRAQFREETNPREHAETGSDDPEGAGYQSLSSSCSQFLLHR